MTTGDHRAAVAAGKSGDGTRHFLWSHFVHNLTTIKCFGPPTAISINRKKNQNTKELEVDTIDTYHIFNFDSSGLIPIMIYWSIRTRHREQVLPIGSAPNGLLLNIQ